jgi:hypothetical protein
MVKKKLDINIFLLLLFYKLLLDLSYIIFVNRYFEYMGFNLDLNISKYIFSIFVFIVLYYFLPKNIDKPSSIFLQLHYIIMIIPMFTIYSFGDKSTLFFVICMFIFSMECFLVKLLPKFKIIRIKKSKNILYSILILITVLVYFSMIRANGFPSLKALNFLNVYDIRGKVSYPFLMPYLVIWQAKVINPFFIVTSYINKDKKVFFIFLSLQVLLYLITAHKSFLFIIFAILLVVKVVHKPNLLNNILKIASFGILAIILLFKITNSLMIPSLFLRRLLFIPAQIKFFYYDFFSNNDFLYFSQGAIGKLVGLEYPYQLEVAQMIGYIYYGNEGTNANTGYLADAYANMGIIGMFFIGLLFVFILILVDSLSIKIGKELTVGLTLFPILSLNDGALLTNLLTGGLLFLLLILYLHSNSTQNREFP